MIQSRPMYLATMTVFGLCCSAAFAAQPEWSSVPGGRAMSLSIVTGKDGFRSLGPELTGIHFTNVLAQERHLTNQILLNGSGVAAGDVDGDGLADLYFCALDGSNKLFRNLGSWKFEEMPGPALPSLDATGAAFADLDGDSDLDLVVNSVGGGTHVLLNDGKARFASQQVLNHARGGMSLAFADIEGDGDLDLYIANYRTITIRDQPNTAFNFKTLNGQPTVVSINGRPLTDPELTNRFEFRVSGTRFNYEENGEADALYINDGKGRFTPSPANTFLGEEG